MKTKTFLALSLAAVFTVAIAFPVSAEAILGLVQTEIKSNDTEITKLRFHATDEIEPSPFGGYAIFTDGGAVIAVTSHAGFYDSEVQTAPTMAQTAQAFNGPAALCNVADVACGPDWHAHLVEPVDSANCSFKAVGELTWEEPSASTKVAGENIILRGITIGDVTLIEALDDDGARVFHTGAPLEGGAAFVLTPVFSGPTLVDVCIDPLV